MCARRVVVTGLGCVTPLGTGAEVFWDRALAGESGVAPITRFDTAGYSSRFAGQCSDFDVLAFLDQRSARRVDPVAQFALSSTIMAVGDAGLDVAAEDPFRVGVIVGSGIGGLTEIETQHTRLLEKGPGKVSPFMIPKLMLNASSGEISIMYGLKGPNFAVVSACASANHAIACAFVVVRSGFADVMLTGGSERAVTPLGMAGFCAMKALSERNDDPTTASRPFDATRDGFVMGEGAGVVVLEELEHARARGARIYCEIVGFGMSGDGSHITMPDETGLGAAAAIRSALACSGVNEDEVDYINAHGTSTVLGDVAETNAIKAIFGDHARRIAISSTKSLIGHLLGASGGVEMVATTLSVAHGRVHPTINQFEPDPKCDLDYVPNEARDRRINVALSNSFGFGGHNSTLALRAFRG